MHRYKKRVKQMKTIKDDRKQGNNSIQTIQFFKRF